MCIFEHLLGKHGHRVLTHSPHIQSSQLGSAEAGAWNPESLSELQLEWHSPRNVSHHWLSAKCTLASKRQKYRSGTQANVGP